MATEEGSDAADAVDHIKRTTVEVQVGGDEFEGDRLYRATENLTIVGGGGVRTSTTVSRCMRNAIMTRVVTAVAVVFVVVLILLVQRALGVSILAPEEVVKFAKAEVAALVVPSLRNTSTSAL